MDNDLVVTQRNGVFIANQSRDAEDDTDRHVHSSHTQISQSYGTSISTMRETADNGLKGTCNQILHLHIY